MTRGYRWRGRAATYAEASAEQRMRRTGRPPGPPGGTGLRALAWSCEICGVLVTAESIRVSERARTNHRSCIRAYHREKTRERRQFGREVSAQERAAGARLHAEKQARTKPVARNHWREWTSLELEIVARDDLTVEEMAVMIGRTYGAVKQRRTVLRQGGRSLTDMRLAQ